MEKVTKGYKITTKHMTCQSYQFELGKRHVQEGELKICKNGFHFCEKISHCFDYYSFSKENRVFEVEAYGDIISDGHKSVALNICLIRELSWEEVLKLANEGSDNTGYSNTGDRNTGDRNTGDRNTGNWNTGDRNTGDRNTGNRNTGDRNTGDRNTGNWNTGNWNTGNWNTGYRNTGYSNTGDRNTGDRNTGDRNTGDRNTGYSNTGDWNTGNWNTGNWNTGYRNTGYSNTGDRNTGLFCTETPPFTIFDQPSAWTEQDFLNSRVFRLMREYVDTKIWIPMSKMTDEEKSANKGWEAAEGYVKDIPFKEAFQNAWHNFTDANKREFISLPNFDAAKFEHITGVKVDTKS